MPITLVGVNRHVHLSQADLGPPVWSGRRAKDPDEGSSVPGQYAW